MQTSLPLSPAETSKIRLLLVEDSPSTRLSIIMMLGFAHNIEVVGAVSTANELLENLYLEPAIILMDMQLPDMEGLAAVKQLTESLPVSAFVIMMSVEELYQERALSLGARAFLPKPFSLSSFQETIGQVLAG